MVSSCNIKGGHTPPTQFFVDGCYARLLLLYTYRGFSTTTQGQSTCQRSRSLILERIWRKYRGLVIKLCSTILERCGALLAEPILYCKTTSSYPFQYLFAIFYIYKILKNSRYGAVHFFFGLFVCKIFVSFSLLDSKKNSYKISQFLRNSPTPISRTTSTRAIIFSISLYWF